MIPIFTICKTISANEERIVYQQFHNVINDDGEIIEENLCGQCGSPVKIKHIPKALMDLGAIL